MRAMWHISQEGGDGSAQHGQSLISTTALLLLVAILKDLTPWCLNLMYSYGMKNNLIGKLLYFNIYSMSHKLPEFELKEYHKLECGPMPNMMADLPNIGGALCSMPQNLADAHY